MFVIQTYQGDRRWIGGVFRDETAARAKLKRMPVLEDFEHEFLEIPVAEFPFFVLEAADGLAFVPNLERLGELLRGIEPAGQPGTTHVIIYSVREEFEAESAERNSMEAFMDATPVDDDFLSRLNTDQWQDWLLS